MPNLSCDDLSFSSLACTFKLLQSKHEEHLVCYAIHQYILEISIWSRMELGVKKMCTL